MKLIKVVLGLLGARSNGPQFDVFLAYHHVNENAVIRIAKALRNRGLKPWLDREQVQPGILVLDVLQDTIGGLVKSVAVVIGPEGLGRWQALELRTAVSLSIERGIPVIPVLLPNAEFPNELLFLKEFNFVRWEDEPNEEVSVRLLEWGITGRRP